MYKGPKWRDEDGREIPLEEAVRQLEKLSPAQAYMARHVLRLSETVGAREREVVELRGTVQVLTDMLLESGAIDEAALLSRVDELVGRVHAAAATTPDDAKPDAKSDAKPDDRQLADGEIDAFLLDDLAPAPPSSVRSAKATEAAPLAKAEARRAEERRARSASEQPAPTEAEPAAEQTSEPASYPVAGYGTADSYYADPFDDESAFGRSRSRGRRIAVVFFLLAFVTAVPVWYFGVYKNPYIGDGPKHLQIDPSRRPGATTTSPESPRRVAAAQKSAAAKTKSPATKKAPLRAEKPAGAAAASTLGAPPKRPIETPYGKLVKEANALFAKRKSRAAFRLLIKAHQLDPNGWEANDRLSWRYYSRGALGRGRRLAKKALSKNAEAPYATLVSAAAADERGQKTRARVRYRRFIALCPRCPEVRDVKSALK